MLEGKRAVDERSYDFSEVFSHQFILSEADLSHYAPGWIFKTPLQGWRLLHCPRLPCVDIRDRKDALVGFLLGIAISDDGLVSSKRCLKLANSLGDALFWDEVESTISNLAGKYIAILLTDEGQRIYFDPVMDMSVVYNPSERIAATSPLLAIRREIQVNPKSDYRLIVSKGVLRQA